MLNFNLFEIVSWMVPKILMKARAIIMIQIFTKDLLVAIDSKMDVWWFELIFNIKSTPWLLL